MYFLWSLSYGFMVVFMNVEKNLIGTYGSYLSFVNMLMSGFINVFMYR